ncbi:MAG TPA: carboxypeptidase-like regulatory domain-containing protein, partial [Thermoanaerobaculia bacterium]|nr:carboxypeptidase-like regulatory domain-containing protein [Thermoanaerobaculia bacterium]
MKRVFIALLLVLWFIPSNADATGLKKRPPKKLKPVTTEEVTLESERSKFERGPEVERERKGHDEDEVPVSKPTGPVRHGKPTEYKATKAAGKRFDLRALPARRPKMRPDRPEREVEPNPVMFEREKPEEGRTVGTDAVRPPAVPGSLAPAPIMDFDGLDREFWGSGSPSDVTGDVGPDYFIQAVNSSVGIYRKSDGFQEAAFTFDTLMAQGSFGNQCDNENFGDPVVLYDTYEDRWILTDFAFTLDGGGNVNPPVAFQCFAVSMNGDPLTGGWNFYSIQINDGLNDYPKLGVWTDGIYMSSNMFGFASGASFQGVRVWALNKYQMYAGAPSVQVVAFDVGTGDFTLAPSNARLQVGTPPAGRPNYFMSTWNFLNAVTVYKFHVDWNAIGNSTFTGPDVPLAATSWPNAAVANAPQLGTATLLDVLQIRAMVQNQYTNMGGVESLWLPHTVRRANTTGFAAPRFYQVDVTGGNVNPNIPQAATFDPDGANVMHRFMPSLAIDRAGNMALGYSTSNSTTVPAIKYAGRLAGDPINTFSQTEQTLFAGVASQTGSTRWGDYTGMSLDPDGCTFWYTNQYGNTDQAANKRWRTRINSMRYPSCTMVGAGGTVSGTVTVTPGGAPIDGATIQFGARSTTTNVSGQYSFLDVPAGTYPSITASKAGYVSQTATNIVVTDGGTTTQDFALALAATSACLTDTTQADFQTGVGTNVDLTTSPGDVILLNAPFIDQQNTTLGTSGVGITVTTWGGQTFTPASTGTMPRVDINLFCSGCTGTTPNLTLSLRATSGGLPTGADLASATITGFNSGASAFYTATFGAPPTLNAGTMYALVIRPTANPAPGTYALTRSGTSTAGASTYAGGTRVAGATSGTVWSIPLTGGVSTDAGFKVFMQTGFASSGNLVSSLKDSNPLAGLLPTWSTLSWTATTPANTSVQFQIAASNSATGPFNFVGPDTTAGTFFTTSGASLSQFNGMRYLKYKAYLATTN